MILTVFLHDLMKMYEDYAQNYGRLHFDLQSIKCRKIVKSIANKYTEVLQFQFGDGGNH